MSPAHCLTREGLSLYLEDRLGESERAEAEDHLSRCASCRRLLVDSHAEANEGETAAERVPEELKETVRSIPRRHRQATGRGRFETRRFGALAAGLVALVGAAALLYVSGRSTIETPSGGDPLRRPGVVSVGPDLLAPSSGSVVGPEAIEFSWEPVSGAQRYVVTVADPLGNVVHESTTQEVSLNLPLSTGELEPGRSYFWFVRAELDDGGRLESEVGRFSVEGP